MNSPAVCLLATACTILTVSPIPVRTQSIDSLHVRDPDSTRIILDTETVPIAIRSRLHELTIINPPGFLPREETGNTGFWQVNTSPQYDNALYVQNHQVRTRLRPTVPSRYFPEHAIIGFRFREDGQLRYPLRTHILERGEEPLVNVAYKKGDYAMNDLSISLATDLTEQTHLHLTREGEGYVGPYAMDGLENERYYISLHHQVGDSTMFLYNTFYTRDHLNWTTALPNIQKIGNEFSSWYYNQLEWQTTHHLGTMHGGLNLGSHRLWLNRTGGSTQLMELQRGGWLGARTSLFESLQTEVLYRFNVFQTQSETTPRDDEYWHRLRFRTGYQRSKINLEGEADLLGLSRYPQWEIHLEPKVRFSYTLWPFLTLTGGYQRDFSAPPRQWSYGEDPLLETGGTPALTQLDRWQVGIELHATDWSSLRLTAEHLQFQDWYTLIHSPSAGESGTSPAANPVDGQLTGLHLRAGIHPMPWLALGSQYVSYPGMSQVLPELWSRQSVTNWLHVQRYFFQNNLLLHLYAENSIYLSRQPSGWSPSIQSITYYPNFAAPPLSANIHLYLIGEVGPFTISTSFYNIVAYQLRYALDQRAHFPIFFLGVRWQFWN